LYYLKIWAKQKMASPWVYKIQNIIPVDVIDLNEGKVVCYYRKFLWVYGTTSVRWILLKMRKVSPKLLLE
jgi:hypothetical protein